MAQPNENDLSTKFSTLNVNAMVFVPSFCSQPSATLSENESAPEQSSPTPDVGGDDVPAIVPEVTGTPSEEIATTTTATPTELTEDKTPENPGERELVLHMCL